MPTHPATLLLALLPLASAADPQEQPDPFRIDRLGPAESVPAAAWRPLFRGVQGLPLAAEAPRPLRGYALRVRLAEPGVRFLVTPSNGDRPLEADSATTSHFLAAHALQAAINAAPFAPVVTAEGVPQDVIGLAISRGELVSPPQTGHGALYLTADNHATIALQQPPPDPSRFANACGGFQIILADGANLGPDDPLHPRSAVGLDPPAQHLYLLAIDGRQPGHSLGASQRELADWLIRLGAHSGLNLDGGGSSSLVVAGPDGSPHILNRPIQSGVPGRERPCPNHLGLYALPLDPPPTPAGPPR